MLVDGIGVCLAHGCEGLPPFLEQSCSVHFLVLEVAGAKWSFFGWLHNDCFRFRRG